MLVVRCLVRTLFLVPRHCLLSVSSPGRRSKGISFIRTLIPPPEAFLLASGEESACQIPESLVDYSPCGHKRAGHDLATKGQSHLPKILPPNTITLGIRFQHTNGCGAGGHKHSVYCVPGTGSQSFEVLGWVGAFKQRKHQCKGFEKGMGRVRGQEHKSLNLKQTKSRRKVLILQGRRSGETVRAPP